VIGMGKIACTGSDKLNEAFARIQDIPFAVTEEALNAMADVAVREIRDTGESMGVRDENSNVHILDHLITKKAKKTDDGGRKKISFDGTRHRGNTDTRNAEIAFVNEYGKRGQPARPFMRTALSQNADLISEPGEKIIGDWIENEYKK
jgi:hypothetical protein